MMKHLLDDFIGCSVTSYLATSGLPSHVSGLPMSK